MQNRLKEVKEKKVSVELSDRNGETGVVLLRNVLHKVVLGGGWGIIYDAVHSSPFAAISMPTVAPKKHSFCRNCRKCHSKRIDVLLLYTILGHSVHRKTPMEKIWW